MSIELKRIGAQYHFFDLVKEEGEMTKWPGDWKREDVGHGKLILPPRPTPEELITDYGVPDRLNPGNCFLARGYGFHYPEGEELWYVDKETGLVKAEIFFEEILPKPFSGEERVHRPRFYTKYTHNPMTYDHPILNEQVEGIMVLSKTWFIDTIFRRHERDSIVMHLTKYAEDWEVDSGEPRSFQYVLVESEFEELPGQEVSSVNSPQRYTERFRAFHFPEAMFVYGPSGESGKMTLSTRNLRGRDHFNIYGKEIKLDSIPQELGEPMQIDF